LEGEKRISVKKRFLGGFGRFFVFVRKKNRWQECPSALRANRRYRLGDGGAGVGDVGVEGGNYGGVFFFDDAAFEFHGEGEAAVVEGEIFGEKSEAFDGFPLGEMGGEAGDFVFDQFADEGMSDHLLIRSE